MLKMMQMDTIKHVFNIFLRLLPLPIMHDYFH